MRKKVNQLEVEIVGDEVYISHSYETGEEANVIITKDQIPLLITWLREAEVVLEEKSSQGGEVAG